MVRWKRLTLFSATAFLVGAGGLWLQRDASAALPVVFKCIGNRHHWLSFNRAASVQASSQGAITVAAGDPTTTSDGRETRALTVLDTYTEGRVEGLGDLVITLDTSRKTPASSLTANQRDRAFPATQVMRFYPLFIINGETFRSADPVQVVNSSVSTFPPSPDTTYVLTNEMTLEGDEGNTITLEPGKAFTITGSGSV